MKTVIHHTETILTDGAVAFHREKGVALSVAASCGEHPAHTDATTILSDVICGRCLRSRRMRILIERELASPERNHELWT